MNESRRRQHLQRMADHGDRWFDPVAGVLAHPENGDRRGDVELLHYALALLELSDRSLQGRAESILSRAVATYSGPEPGRGVEPMRMEAECMALLFIWFRHRRRLASGLAEGVLTAASCGADCIRESDVGLAGAFVLLAVGEATERDDLGTRGQAALVRLRDGRGGAGEDLVALHAIMTYVRDAKARETAGGLASRLWRELADDESPEAMGDLVFVLLERSGAQAVGPGRGFGDFTALPACVVNVDVPVDASVVLAKKLGGKPCLARLK